VTRPSPEHDGYTVSTDRDRLDLDVVHRFLSTEAYWSPGVARAVVERSIEGSMPFGVYLGAEQVGFARVVTDGATFAWLADVFVLPGHRGRGLGKWLVEEILSHAELQGLRRWLLGTADAHELYRRFGFEEVDNSSGRFMARETGAAAQQCSAG
jgi:GNAT superfamily N-acetyltransferase